MSNSQSRSLLKEAIIMIPKLLRLLFKTMGDRRVSFSQKLLLFGTILYVISPLDLVPDFIPFTGQVDDILLLAVIVLKIMQQAGHSIFQDNWKDRQGLSDLAQRILKLASSFLPSSIYNRIVKDSDPSDEVIDVKYRVHKD
ncbi:MAG: YkvA family protein [Bacillota bacterium]